MVKSTHPFVGVILMGSAWSSDFLDHMRQKADPLADSVVEELFQKGQIRTLNQVMDHLTRNSQPLPTNLPECAHHFFEASAQLPAEVDLAQVERGQTFFLKNGPAIGVALMYSSLPTLFAGAQGGVQILAMTGQLKQHYRRRAAETLHFILDVMSHGGLSPQGQGIRAVQKVRLMHATIRYFARHSGQWAGLPPWGAPINQEELAGTLLSFSMLALDCIGKLGVKTTSQESQDYLYAWHVIGHLLGIAPELRPLDVKSGRALWNLIAKRNFAPTEAGKNLARDHLAFLDEMIPTHALDRINAALMRYLMGKTLATHCLGIHPTNFGEWLVDILRMFFGWLQILSPSHGPLNSWIQELHKRMMDGLEHYWADGKNLGFRLPEGLGDPV